MKLIRILLVFLLVSTGLRLQAQQEVEMADKLRADGKIYVVVAIILVIFIGIVLYLFSIDRKVSRLEKRFPEKKAWNPDINGLLVSSNFVFLK